LEQFDVILIIQLSQTVTNSEVCGIFSEGDAVLGSDSNEIASISILDYSKMVMGKAGRGMSGANE
jgi:hypothetical protein